MGCCTTITLEQMLQARDTRAARQRELRAAWPEAALVVLTIVAPGREKRNRQTAVVAKAGAEALDSALAGFVLMREERALPTGYELFMVVDLPCEQAKRHACEIEESHPLGRLMDIDVIGTDMRPLSRTELQLPPRRCLMCGDDARVCMRLGRHSYADLIKQINDTVNAYVSEL